MSWSLLCGPCKCHGSHRQQERKGPDESQGWLVPSSSSLLCPSPLKPHPVPPSLEPFLPPPPSSGNSPHPLSFSFYNSTILSPPSQGSKKYHCSLSLHQPPITTQLSLPSSGDSPASTLVFLLPLCSASSPLLATEESSRYKDGNFFTPSCPKLLLVSFVEAKVCGFFTCACS